MKTKKMLGSIVAGGTMLVWGGGCLPDGFWVNAFDTAATSAVETFVVDFVADNVDVVDPAFDVNNL